MVIGYTDGYTARIFCILDFSDKFRYIRYTEKSFENNVSQCYGLFDSTGSYWTGMRLRYTRLRGRLYCRIYWILYCIPSILRNVCINQYKVVISIYAVYPSGYTSISIYTHQHGEITVYSKISRWCLCLDPAPQWANGSTRLSPWEPFDITKIKMWPHQQLIVQ